MSALVLLVIVAVVTLVRRPATLQQTAVLRDALTSVDPNTAPWWELTVLPRIGASLGRRIVRFRESAERAGIPGAKANLYTGPSDLATVRGIGPKTVRRISPFLRFEEPVR